MARRDPIRVLILIKGLGLGGAESLVVDSARCWNRDRFEYRVAYLLPWKDQLVPKLRNQGISVSDLGWNSPRSVLALRRFRHVVDKWKPDVVHSHLPVAGVIARLSTRTRHVYTEHNLVDFYKPITRFANRATYGLNDAVIAVSEAVAASTAKYPGPTPEVIPNGISSPIIDREPAAIREELGLAPATPLLVHVGNIRPHKGQANLIRAAQKLTSRVPEFMVVLIGSEKSSGDIARLEALASELGVADRIRLLGQRNDATSFMAAADVVVNPADVEGLPLSILEAMALERPVVATAVGGVPTVIRNRVTGLLVEPGDPIGLAEALAEALTSEYATDWGHAAGALVKQNHSIDEMVRRYESVYDRIAR